MSVYVNLTHAVTHSAATAVTEPGLFYLEMFTQVKMTGEMRKTRVAQGIRQRLQKTEITTSSDFFSTKNGNVEWAAKTSKNF